MEEIIELIFGLIVVVAAAAAKGANKSKKAVQQKAVEHNIWDSMQGENVKNTENVPEKPLKAAAPAAVSKVAANEEKPVQTEPHLHEGRQDVPCPVTEARPSERREESKAAVAEIPGLQLAFDRNAVLQGFVMSEILNRPRPGNRR